MAYEYLFRTDKPLDAQKIREYLESRGFRPIVVRVDNTTGQIFIFLQEDKTDKKELDEAVNDYLRKAR